MLVLAIIPARGGSKRVPNKNIRDFCGKPLIAHAIEQALGCSVVDRVIVDTDSKEIAEVAKHYGAEVPWLRPEYLATDESKIIDSILYNIKQLEEKENYIPDYVMLLQATTPLRNRDDIDKCWDAMQKNDATTTVSVFDTNPRPSDFLVVENNYVRQGVFDFAKEGINIFGYNGFVYIMKRDALLKEERIITSKTKVVTCDKWRSVDIDTFEDFVLAEFLYKNKEYLFDCIDDLKSKI